MEPIATSSMGGPPSYTGDQHWTTIASFVTDLRTLLSRSLLWLVSLLPPDVAFAAAKRLGRLKCSAGGSTVTRLREEIEAALRLSAGAANSVAIATYERALWEEIEGFRHEHMDRESVSKFIEVRGLEHLENALASNRGAILCTGHVRGLFTFIVALATTGYKVNVVRRAPRAVQGPVGRWFNKRTTLLEGQACRYLWMHESNLGVAVKTANALKRGEIVIMLVDSRFGTEVVTVQFMNRSMRLPSGHIVLAKVLRVPLLNAFVHSRPSLPRVAEIGPPYYVTADVSDSVQDCVSQLERSIFDHPADWIWYSEREVWNLSGPEANVIAKPATAHTVERT